MHVRFVPGAPFLILLKYVKVLFMDPETKQLLVQNIELSKENNEMLHRLVRAQKITNVYRIVYWGIIILSALGVFYFMQSFLGNIMNIYSGVGGTGLPKINKIGDILNQSNNKQQVEDLIQMLR